MSIKQEVISAAQLDFNESKAMSVLRLSPRLVIHDDHCVEHPDHETCKICQPPLFFVLDDGTYLSNIPME